MALRAAGTAQVMALRATGTAKRIER
jgi:hypothetical protein